MLELGHVDHPGLSKLLHQLAELQVIAELRCCDNNTLIIMVTTICILNVAFVQWLQTWETGKLKTSENSTKGSLSFFLNLRLFPASWRLTGSRPLEKESV